MNGSNRTEPLRLTKLSVYGRMPGGERTTRLEEATLALAPGEWIYVVGTNGSGKSTLAQLLAGLVQEGAAGGYSRGFAGLQPAPYVMQQPDAQLFGSTPREELVFALEWRAAPPERIAAAAAEMLAAVGLREAADEPWSRLSGGQRQLAVVAAAAVCEAPLLVLDEATSMLDESARRRVRGIAERLHARGAAIVWVTQRLDELDPDARVIALRDAQIRFDGTGRQFLYGPDPLRPSRSGAACEQVGLRLPYLAELAYGLHRLGKLAAPLPATAEEWRRSGIGSGIGIGMTGDTSRDSERMASGNG
ncbi:ABC transporter ATP-binding protein [Cohnella sp. REN36]|uniref:ATP-binding cassette domain-containing protein n=1 Tax=Cohnella sp. REN36 TaxID=2887347 RepID=UPI001D15AD1A|nr:ABC transporter ATP-binding protein [Cohnella sp. REN36]MCC3371782.1 energy-coupling factor ABC transporter ATP-binding protein [Cohnella sp. REN36]